VVIENHMSRLYQINGACCLWMAMAQSSSVNNAICDVFMGFVDDTMFVDRLITTLCNR